LGDSLPEQDGAIGEVIELQMRTLLAGMNNGL